MFNNYLRVNFPAGLAELSLEVFHEREPTLMIVDDLMVKSNKLRGKHFHENFALPQY